MSDHLIVGTAIAPAPHQTTLGRKLLMTRTGPVGVGFIGTGMISNTYLENLARFPDIDVIILGDLDVEAARARAEQHGVRQWGTADDVLNHPDVEVVVNLTIPAVHAEVASKAIAAGKHVWTEKPISVDRQSGHDLLVQAEEAGLLVGIAPDTVLGPGMQTARRAIARGDIGQPLSAQTVMQYIGPDIFHPNPQFLFSPGAGPLFDIGPYYLTALIQLFGSVASVAAVGSRARATRTIQAGDRVGTVFDVQVPTHVSAIARFVDGAVSQSVFSFDSPLTRMGYVEVTGTDGTMIIPDPNLFTGDVKITRAPAFVVDRSTSRSGRPCPSPAPTPNEVWGCSIWLGRPGRAASPWPRESWASTSSTPSSPSTKPSPRSGWSRSRAGSTACPWSPTTSTPSPPPCSRRGTRQARTDRIRS